MFGGVHRAVCAGEQALRSVDRGCERPADGNAYDDGDALAPNFRLGHQDPYSLGRFSQAGIVGGFDQHRELFASPASHDVARESGSDRLQHRIAGGVAM